jgi:Galactose oxidase, central domain
LNRSIVRLAGAALAAVALLLAACSGGVSNTDTTSAVTTFTVGGTITGLSGAGLVLQNNGGDDLDVTASGSFVFPTTLITGNRYMVSVLSQPSSPAQTCVVANGGGVVANGNITTIAIQCADKTSATDTIGGTAVGVLGSGLVLQDNAGDNLAVASNGSFTFATPLASGTPYLVTVFSAPVNPYQDCVIANAAGTTGADNVTNVAVSCTTNTNPTYTIGGTASGISSTQPLMLQDNGRDTITLSKNGPFTFPLAIPSGSTYKITLAATTQQQSQTCTFTNAGGTVAGANVTNVSVACVANQSVSVSVSGLVGTGLVLQDNGQDNFTVTKNGTSKFPIAVATGSTYKITVLTQPTNPSQTCTVANGSGTAGAGAAVQVTCSTRAYTVGGSVSNLLGTGLSLKDNAGNAYPIAGTGTVPFTLPGAIVSGAAYAVTVASQPVNPTQICSVAYGSGTVAAGNVTNVQVTCVTQTYTVGGTVSNLRGTGLSLKDNAGNAYPISGTGTVLFTLPGTIASGAAYAVTVASQPIYPTQICTVAYGSGTVGAGNVTSVQVTCATQAYTVGGTVSNLRGTGLTLRDNAGNPYPIAGTGTVPFTLPGVIASGTNYAVTVATQPTNPSQTCTVANGSGTVGAGNVTAVQVTCVTQMFTVGGTVSNLQGTGLSLRDNAGTAYAIPGIGTTVPFMIPGTVASGAGYAVTIATQPVNPSQTCTVTQGSGTVGAGNVTSVQVTCVTQGFTVGGTVSNLVGTGLSLRDNAGTPYAITGTGTVPFTIPGTVASGAPYAVTVATQPVNPSQMCTVNYGSGTVGAGNITTVQVTCVIQTFTVGGKLARYIAPPADGGGMTLANGTDTLTPPANATTFAFPTLVASGQPYAVTIQTQPAGQSCQLTNGTGTVGAGPVTSVQINCTYWEWTAGNPINSNAGVYGTIGVAAATNQPGGREGGLTWTDAAGNFWLFGGYGLDSTGTYGGWLNDLWKYDTTAGEWTWMSGSNTTYASSTFGTLGTAATGNTPGARYLAVSWTDSAGNFWLFGGYGESNGGGESDENSGILNDLWKYNPTTNLWTWMGGSQAANMSGVYGTQNVAAAANIPGAREESISWVDKSGNLWLFGGYGDIVASSGELNDLWKYSTATGLWTWVSGSSTATDAASVYVTEGTPAAGNVPGARDSSVSWIDASGNLWLFGGNYVIYNAAGAPVDVDGNDLWRFNTTTGQWTFMSGSTAPSATGVYGTEGVPAAGNVPGARDTATSWTDAAGNFWLFGGNVKIGTAPETTTSQMDDMWEYVPSTNQWTWVAGYDAVDFAAAGAPAVYGTEGVPSVGTTPGGRSDTMKWIDPVGNLWLFGGYPINEYVDTETPQYPTDMWKFVPFNLAP